MPSVSLDGETDARTGEARFRKIECAMWVDQRFARLSPMLPSGQGLWIFLLTNPDTGLIPGLYRAGRAGLAEALGWDIADFDSAFAELEREGMARADWRARLVWLPKALDHNPPPNPNVVTRWAREFDLLPECALRFEALAALGRHTDSRSSGFAEAFEKAFGAILRRGFVQADTSTRNHSGNGSINGSGNHSGNHLANGFDNGSGNHCGNHWGNQEQEAGAGAGAGAGINTEATPLVVSAAAETTRQRLPACPTEELLGLWNEICAPPLPNAGVLNESRRRALSSRWRDVCKDAHFDRQGGLDWFRWMLAERVAESDFLMGRKSGRGGKEPFRATLDWLMAPTNFAKVVDGNYANGGKG
jgi:hypothetical protein